MSIIESMLINIGGKHSNATLIQQGRGKYSYRVKIKEKDFFLKIWQHTGTKERIKHFIRIDNSSSEYRNANHLRSRGIRVPEIFFFARVSEKHLLTNIHVTEFISTNLTAFQYIKENCLSKTFKEVTHFSDNILTLTEDIINAGIIDPDHRLKNIMVNVNGDPVKIDLEIAFKNSRFSLHRKGLCDMLGTLIYSYVFAVQPNIELASQFTSSVYKRFNLDNHSKKVINNIVMPLLEKQLKETGIDSRFNLLI